MIVDRPARQLAVSVRRSLAWSYGAQAFIFLQTFAVSIAVARILGPYEMGIYAVGAATAGAISIISSFGVGSYVIRHQAPDAALRATAFTVNASLNVLVSSVVLSVVAIGSMWGLLKEVRQVLMILALLPLIGIFEFLPSTFMHREMNFKIMSVISTCRSLVNSAILLPLAWAGWGYLSLAIATVGSSIFTTIAFNIVARSHVSLALGLKGWREMTKFGMQMMSIGGLAALMQRMSELILGHFLGIATLGIYGRASGLMNQIWENVYGLSTRVIFAQMAKELRETNTVRNTYTHGLALLTAVLGPLFVGIAVLSPPIVQTLYGDKWIGAALPLSVLMMTCVVLLAFSMNWELCVLRHRTAWQARNEGIRAAVGLVAFSIGASISVGAAAAGRFVEAVCGFVLFSPKMGEMAGTEPGEIAAIYRQSTVLTLGAVAPVVALMIVTGWSSRTSWLLVVPCIGMGALTWLALVRWYEHPLWAELTRVARLVADWSRRRVG